METAQQAARRAIWDYHAIIEDAERALEASDGECTPEYSALEALASDTLEYALEQIKLAHAELDAKADANKTLEQKYAARKKVYAAQVERLEQEAIGLLHHAGQRKVVTATGTVAIRPPSKRVEVDEGDEEGLRRLEDLGLARREWKVDKRDVAAILKKGENSLPACALVDGEEGVRFT